MADLKLSFIKDLNEDQLKQAEKVGRAAIAMGIDPSFAISIAFKEGSLDPNTIDSPKKAIGMMQVIPKTGAAYGYSEKDLRDPDKNLDAGLKNLKESLAYANNKPMLAAVYYHSGPDAIKDQAAGKPLGPNALEYVKALKGFNTFELFNPDFKASAQPEGTPAAQPEPAPQPSETNIAGAKVPTTAEDFIRADSEADLKRDEYGLYGLGVGTGVAIAPKASQIASGALGRTMRAFDEGRRPPSAPTGGLPTGGAPTPPQMPAGAPMGSSMGTPAGGLPTTQGGAPMGPADAGRMAQGQTGVIPYNTAKALGLTDIEAAQALTNTKQEGGAWDLAEKRREALNKVKSMGGNNFVENPRFGGIMTQAPSVGRGPRESFVMRPEIPASPDMPTGQPSQLAPLPKAPIVSTVPPVPSGLDQAKNIFMGMMRQGAKYLPVVGPPLAGLSIARDVADIESQYERRPIERDYTDIALSGAGALATGASLYPPAFPVAAPLSIGIPTFRNIRRNVLAQESDPELQRRNKMPPTEEEIAAANRPFIGYPRP
jgi:hypothetical protein